MADYPVNRVSTELPDAAFSTSEAEVERDFEAILNRMKSAINAKSDTELGSKMGLKQSAISSAKTRGQIPAAWVVSMAQDHGISADWLLTGVGQPYVESTRGKTAADFRDRKIPQMENIRPGTAIDARASRMVTEPLAPVVSAATAEYIECMDCQLTMVPMVEARLSAGTGSFEVGDSSERRYAFRSDWINMKGQASKMVLMRVAGDSMEPQIFNEDVVLVDQSQTTPRAGGLFAVGVEDLVYLKVVDAVPGKFILKSYNEAYAPLEIDARGDLADGIRIIGRAVWIGRELY